MMPLEAIEPTLVAPQVVPRWAAGELLSRMLHAVVVVVVVSEHPYAYLVATEQRLRPRA
jgi:hypothetical protein